MAERKESSVLFSLRELRSIEEERIQEEESARVQAETDRRRAIEDAERRAREEEEARRRAIEDAEKRERDERERVHREERLRVEEAERRARVEAQAAIEQQRMHKEMELRALEVQKKRPTGLIAVAAILVLAVAGLGFWAYNRSQQADKEKREAAAQLAALEKQITDTQADMDKAIKEKDAEYQKLLAAKTDADKAAAQRAIDQKNAEIEAQRKKLNDLKGRAHGGGGGGGGDHHPDDGTIKHNCDPNDPLCGLK